MERRRVVGLVGMGLLAEPFEAQGQAPLPVIGYLSGRTVASEGPIREPLLKSLEASGYLAGRNVAFKYHDSQGQDERLTDMATDLARQQVAVIVATSNSAAVAARKATSSIPIVFSMGDDPVRRGLVASLGHPGGNATGVHVFTSRLGTKRLSLIRALLPKPGPIAFIVDPANLTTQSQVEEVQQSADSVGQPLVVLRARNESEIETAFDVMAKQKVRAVLYGASLFFQVIHERLIERAARDRLLACYEWREAVLAGGLMSYNADRAASSAQVGRYVAQILKGTRPADLPVVQASTFLLTINLRTARSLDLKVPATLLTEANEVIE